MESRSTIEAVLRRDRLVATVLLAGVVVASWLYLLAGAGTGMYPHEMASLYPRGAGADPPMSGNSGTLGHLMTMPPARWDFGYALLMFLMWWLMMIAMMLPSAAPAVLLHAAIARKGHACAERPRSIGHSRPLLPATVAFVAGYLLMWGLFSLMAVGMHWALQKGGLLNATMTSTSRILGAVLLMLAGLWQLTPVKAACLRQCRSPAGFLAAHWRSGTVGALEMGTKHGLYCLGCCWVLMTLLFLGGVMNLVWIVGIALYVLAEKMLGAGILFGRITGLLLVGCAVWLGVTAI